MLRRAWSGEPIDPAERNLLFPSLACSGSEDGPSPDQVEIGGQILWCTNIVGEYNPRLARPDANSTIVEANLPCIQMAWLHEGFLAVAFEAIKRVRQAFEDQGMNADVDCDEHTGSCAGRFKLPWTWDPTTKFATSHITLQLSARTQPSRCEEVAKEGERPSQPRRTTYSTKGQDEQHTDGSVI